MDRRALAHFAHWPPGVPRELVYPATGLFYNLEVSAHRYPDKPAIVFYGHAIAYRTLHDEVLRLAAFLQHECGVARGDRIVLFLQNSPQWVMAFYAAMRVDAVVVPVNAMNLTEELAHMVADSGARVAVVGQELLDRVTPLLESGAIEHAIVAAYSDWCGTDFDLAVPEAVVAPAVTDLPKRCIAWRNAFAPAAKLIAPAAGPDDLALLAYTSGTTGRPKGCMHSHATIMSTAVGMGAWFGATAAHAALATLPLVHVTGMQGGMNVPIWLGQTVYLMQRWDRAVAAALIERHRIAIWRSISTMLIDFLDHPEIGRFDLSSLTTIGGGGAAIPEAIGKKLRDLVGLECIEGYGLTETMAPSHYNPPQRPKRQCLGIPIFGVDSRVIDPDTLRELPAGEVGEIVMAGPQIFLGYWRAPEATREAFVELDGKRFFRSGDLGRIDEDGYFFMADRLKRMINAAGLKVWPAEVEGIMHSHPDILECCVVGARDAYRGETVKAVVVLKDGRRSRVTADDVVAWCREHMAAYKVPRIVEFAESLPKSGSGKVMWRVLQEKEQGRA